MVLAAYRKEATDEQGKIRRAVKSWFVIKKNLSHGPFMRQTMCFKAHDMLRKAHSNENGNCKTILERWYKDEQYRKSLSDIGWTEEQIKQYDALALEDHSYVTAPEKRGRFQNSWKISLIREGIQGPIKQRPEFIEAKQKCIRLYNEHAERTGEANSPIHPSRHDQQYEGLDEYNYTVDPRTRWRFYPSTRSTTSSSSAHWEQHDNWKSNQSWDSWRSSTWTEH